MQLFMETTDALGRVMPGLHTSVSGECPRELVEAMVYPSPFTESQTLRQYMRAVLRRIGASDRLPCDMDAAAQVFLCRLRRRGLVVIFDKDDPRKMTPKNIPGNHR
jgi:hypothetical protein